MNEEFNNSKNSRKVAISLICIIIVLATIIAGIFIIYALKNSNEENVGKFEQPKTDTTTINHINANKYMAAFKYDLKNNQLSNFDIAFLKVENNKENKVYSPLSIKYALKMLEEGANGTTKQQISNVLEDYIVTKYISNKNMSLANALFVRDTFKDSIKQSYVNNLQSEYNAEVVYDSFANAKNVNSWVKNKTLDILPEILDDINEDQDFLLINALGIDMEWKNKFFDKDNNYKNGFQDDVHYNHENYYGGCNTNTVKSRKFDNDKQEVSGMEIFASMDNYDIVKILGEDNIRKTVEEKYRAWIKEHGTNFIRKAFNRFSYN